MKDFTVDFELLKASLYGTEQEQAKARNTLKQLVESKEDSTVPVHIGDLYSTFDRLKELETSSKVNAEDCNEAERILRNIIKEWSSSNDVFGAIQQAVEFLK